MPIQKFQDLEKSACSHDLKTNQACGGLKDLSTDISALYPQQDPREAYMRLFRANYFSIAPQRAGWVLTRKIDYESNCSADTNFEDSFEVKNKADVVFVNLTVAHDPVWHLGPYLLASEACAELAHGRNDHGAFLKPKFCPYHW